MCTLSSIFYFVFFILFVRTSGTIFWKQKSRPLVRTVEKKRRRRNKDRHLDWKGKEANKRKELREREFFGNNMEFQHHFIMFSSILVPIRVLLVGSLRMHRTCFVMYAFDFVKVESKGHLTSLSLRFYSSYTLILFTLLFLRVFVHFQPFSEFHIQLEANKR